MSISIFPAPLGIAIDQRKYARCAAEEHSKIALNRFKTFCLVITTGVQAQASTLQAVSNPN